MKRYDIQHFFDPATSTLTYVVSDPATRDAVVIDPVLDFDPAGSKVTAASVEVISKYLRDAGLNLRWVLETHAHADHLSGAQLLRERFGAKTAIGARITEVQRTFGPMFDLPASFRPDGSQWDRLLADGEVLEAGSIRIEAIATPGHTPACTTYRIGDALFTGDTLFIEDLGTGRCDFPNGSPEALFDSIQKLYRFPDETRVFVGHDYPPAGRTLRFETTIGAEKQGNAHVKADSAKQPFVDMRKARDAKLSPPKLLLPSLRVNVDAGRLPEPRPNGRRYLTIPLDAAEAR